MDGSKTKDVLSTVIGGGTGVDLFWTGLEGIVDSLNANEPVKVADCKWLVYGMIAAYLGYRAWKDNTQTVVHQTTITQEVTKQP